MKILVASCDDYSVTWEPFFKCFEKFWPDCPYPIYLISEKKYYRNEEIIIRSITLNGLTQTKRISTALNIIDGNDEILFMQEDYILNNYIKQDKIKTLLEIFKNNKLDCLRLHTGRLPDYEIKGIIDGMRIGIISINAPYRVCCLPAIWKRETLKYYMENTKDIWDFEVKGTKLSYNRKGELFRGVYEDIIPCFTSAIKRGVWTDEAIEFLSKEGIKIENKIVKTGVAENR